MGFDTTTGQLIWHEETKGKRRCELWEDHRGEQRIIHKTNLNKEFKRARELASTWHAKDTHLFNSSVRDGDRVIANVPRWILAMHPELEDDPQAMLRFLDDNPQWKAIPAMWTSTTPSKKLHTGVNTNGQGLVTK